MSAARTVSTIALCAVAMAVAGALVGVVTGLSSRTLHIIGLYEVTAGLTLAFAGVTLAHLLRVRRGLVAMACIAALAWLAGHHGSEAWLLRLEQARTISEQGLLLADHALIHDSDDPEELADAALLAETGASGVQGAARLVLKRGLRVQAVAGHVRVLPLPLWAHVLFYALQAALIAIWLGRALGHLADEPICPRCGAWLRRRTIGYVGEDRGRELAVSWRAGERLVPGECEDSATSDRQLLVLEDRCPNGHTEAPGYEVRRRRRLSLTGVRPGPLGRLEARESSAEAPHAVRTPAH